MTLTFPFSLLHLWNTDDYGIEKSKFDPALWDESFDSRDKSKKNPLLSWKVEPGDEIKHALAHAGQDGGFKDVTDRSGLPHS